MSIISKILTYSAHARDEVRRAIDPETGNPFPTKYKPGMTVKLGAWLLTTSWGSRVILRLIAAASGSLSVWLTAHGAGEHTGAIVAGVVSALTFLSEILISFLNKKAGIANAGVTQLTEARAENPAYLFAEENERRPSIFDLPNKPLYNRLHEEPEPEPEAEHYTDRFHVPGALPSPMGFPTTAQLAAEVKAMMPPPAPKFSVEWKDGKGHTKKEKCDSLGEAISFRDGKRSEGFTAKLITCLAALLLVGCAVDPATGKKRYAGPNISLSAGYQGVTAGLTLWGFHGETKVPPVTPAPATVEVMGVPLNSK